MVGVIVPELVLLKDSLYYFSIGNDYDTPDVEKNKMVMALPSFLGQMTHLTYLNLEGLGLTSSIPDSLFSSWTRMESLYMNANDITGTLPTTIKNLKSIKVLWLGGNNLGGPIISEIGQLTTLVDLSLESNFREDKVGKRGFMTSLPPEMAQLTNLEILDLSDNALSGSVPAQLGDLISLRRLDLSNNFFENQLPTALSRLQMLEDLDISFNWYVHLTISLFSL
jgi:Leucine-rich repeat (LRR) protein